MLRIKSVFATKAAKVTAATMAMLLAMSGVAIAGVLPASIQDPVADAVQTVGINLPGGADEIDGDNGPGGENIDEGDVNQIEEEDVTDVEGVDQSDDQGAQPGLCSGHDHQVGIARPSAAPSWLPLAIASGCAPPR